MTMPDVNKIIDFEQGLLDQDESLELFSGLVKSGLVWQLQGSYGRTAQNLIDAGYLSPEGEVLAAED